MSFIFDVDSKIILISIFISVVVVFIRFYKSIKKDYADLYKRFKENKLNNKSWLERNFPGIANRLNKNHSDANTKFKL